jgi:hypothetical protein
MKKLQVQYWLAIIFLLGLAFTGCKKDETKTDLTKADLALVEDAETQDAVVDQVEQNSDNVLDQVESNDFSSKVKSGMDCITVTVDKQDTISFPKTLTLVYNCLDTINGEKITQTGTITIVIDTIAVHKKMPWRAHIKRTITFTNFMVSTDSSSITINGTRTMKRLGAKSRIIDNTVLRVEENDSIIANLNFTVKYDGINKTITRKANKVRHAIKYFRWGAVASIWKPEKIKDTIVIEGIVTGINAKEEAYSRTITDPIKFTFCPVWPFNPIISEGAIEFAVGEKEHFTIMYSAEECKTMVIFSKDGKTKEIERRLAAKYRLDW